MNEPLTPVNFERYDFLFDTNSIRDLVRRIKSEEEWTDLVSKWKRHGFKTAWMPGTIAELIGTNLIGNRGPLPIHVCQEIALAVRRFDLLAKQTFIPTLPDLLKWVIGSIAGDYCPFPQAEEWGPLIRRARRLSHPDELEVVESTNASFSIRMQLRNGEWIGQTVPLGFEEKALKESAAWRERLATKGFYHDNMAAEEVNRVLNERGSQESILSLMIEKYITNTVVLAKSLGIHPSTIQSCMERFPKQSFSNPLLFGMGVQDWYYILRAYGIKTGAVEESFGRDLLFAYNVPLTKHFVTSDKDMRKAIDGILPRNSLTTFDEFLVACRGEPSTVRPETR